MKRLFFSSILWLILLLFSCGSTRKVATEKVETEKQDIEVVEEEVPPEEPSEGLLNAMGETVNVEKSPVVKEKLKEENDWMCVAGKRVGAINRNTSLKDLERLFGAANISEDSLRVRGDFVPATKVFGGTPNELRIAWKGDSLYQRIVRVIIQQEGGEWHTEQGIKVGTPLREVEQINEVPFAIFGFRSPYAGSVFNWEDGVLAEQNGFSLRFKYTTDLKKITSKELEYVMIEDDVTTDLEVYEEMGVVVSHIYIFF